jgi:hypothetical protein
MIKRNLMLLTLAFWGRGLVKLLVAGQKKMEMEKVQFPLPILIPQTVPLSSFYNLQCTDSVLRTSLNSRLKKLICHRMVGR